MTDTVIFDVGGKEYKVARTLLDMHPDSMVANMASKRWNGDGDKKLFVERDCERFRSCLDYMRDGKVFLPLTINKKSSVADMEYYGIDLDEAAIHLEDSSAVAVMAMKKNKDIYAYLNKNLLDAKEVVMDAERNVSFAEKEVTFHQFVKNCYSYYIRDETSKGKVQYRYYTDEFKHYMHEYRNRQDLHKLFAQVGLKVDIKADYSDCVLENIDI